MEGRSVSDDATAEVGAGVGVKVGRCRKVVDAASLLRFLKVARGSLGRFRLLSRFSLCLTCSTAVLDKIRCPLQFTPTLVPSQLHLHLHFHRIAPRSGYQHTMAAARGIPDITRAITGRAVHLRVVPRPQNLAESREVLRSIQRFGEVEMYRNLKYDVPSGPTSALAIFREPDSVKELLRESPLRFPMQFNDSGAVHGDEYTVEGDMEDAQSAQSLQSEQTLSERSQLGVASSEQDQARGFSSTTAGGTPNSTADDRIRPPPPEYQVQINIATFPHHDHIALNQFHGPFAVDTKSAAQEDLARRVPLLGLSDIDLDKMAKPWRVVEREKAYERRVGRTLREMFNEGQKNKTKMAFTELSI